MLNVAISTLKWDNMLFRLFFDRFPEREYTTLPITKHDMTVDRIYDKLNEHLQSNDQIASEGKWTICMVVSRLAVDKRKKKKKINNNRNVNMGNNNNDDMLEG